MATASNQAHSIRTSFVETKSPSAPPYDSPIAHGRATVAIADHAMSTRAGPRIAVKGARFFAGLARRRNNNFVVAKFVVSKCAAGAELEHHVIRKYQRRC